MTMFPRRIVKIGQPFTVGSSTIRTLRLDRADEMVGMLRRAGFSDASHHLLSGGLTQQLLGTRDD